jgi:ABC-type transport system substrate-binding protein
VRLARIERQARNHVLRIQRFAAEQPYGVYTYSGMLSGAWQPYVKNFAPNHVDDAQLIQSYLKDVGIEAELKIQEHGAYMATTTQGKFEGLVRGPFGIAWEPDAPLYRSYAADSSWNAAHIHDPTITAMLKEQRRTKDLEARRKIIFDIQRYAAEHQYYVYTNVIVITASWAPYVKNYGPNITFHYGSSATAPWLDR